MGDFTNAVLTRTGSGSCAYVRAAVEQFAATLGLVPSADGEPCHREWSIADGGGEWILVTDSDTDHAPLACDLSRALDATTLTWALYDGDTTYAALYTKGKRAARLAMGQSPIIARRRVWAEALALGISLERFHEAVERLRDQSDPVDELARLFGCTTSALAGRLPSGGEALRLRFRRAVQRAWEIPASGPGVLRALYDVRREGASLVVGQRHRTELYAQNHGGAFRRLRIEIGGEAVYAGLLVPSVVRVSAAGNNGQRIEVTASHEGNEPIVVVADVSVAAGRAGLPTDRELADLGAREARNAGRLEVTVDAIARLPGTGSLRIVCRPSIESEGEIVAEEVVVVSEAVWRPRRAAADGHTSAFDVLASERITSAFVVYDCARDLAAQHARELFEIVFGSHRSRRVEGKTLDDLGIPTKFEAKNDDALVTAMLSARLVVLERPSRAAFDPFAGDRPAEPSGWFGAPVAGDDPSVPIGVVNAPFGQGRDALHEAIERAAARGLVLQATLASWGEAATVVRTPYEKAVGIEGKDATRRSWVSRYLRAVGDDTLWFGAPLVMRLPEATRTTLEHRVTASGAWAIAVGGRQGRTAVENAIEALLPSAADFKAFRASIWGR